MNSWKTQSVDDIVALDYCGYDRSLTAGSALRVFTCSRKRANAALHHASIGKKCWICNMARRIEVKLTVDRPVTGNRSVVVALLYHRQIPSKRAMLLQDFNYMLNVGLLGLFRSVGSIIGILSFLTTSLPFFEECVATVSANFNTIAFYRSHFLKLHQ
jgi:hypothetical protein